MKKWCAVVLVVCLVVLVSCTKSVPIPDELVEFTDACTSGLGDYGVIVSALSSSDLSGCVGQSFEGFCSALVLHDASRCLNSSSCEAMALGDSLKCGDGDTTCFAFIAQDASLCEEYADSDPEEFFICDGLARRDATVFSGAKASQLCKDQTLYLIAESSADCAVIKNSVLRDRCVESKTIEFALLS